jgi:pimeloyl-ACP methyl ester carboxylesterase
VLVVAAGGVDMKRLGAHDWRPQDRAENPSRPAWAHAQTVDLSSELHRIEVPALLVWATRDVLSPLSVAERMAAKLPKARLITFDTDDHWVARRFADETAKAIHDFVLEADAPPVVAPAAPTAPVAQPAVAQPDVAQPAVAPTDVPTNDGPLTE